MAYSAVVMWMWVVALGATLVGLLMAARGLARAEAARTRLQVVVEAVDVLPAATAALDGATVATRRARDDLRQRAPGPTS